MCPIEKKPRHPLTPHAASTCAERKSLTKCDAFSWPPIGTGRFEQLIGVEWVFLGFTRGGQYLSEIAHLNPLTGSVALADCDESSFVADCATSSRPRPTSRWSLIACAASSTGRTPRSAPSGRPDPSEPQRCPWSRA